MPFLNVVSTIFPSGTLKYMKGFPTLYNKTKATPVRCVSGSTDVGAMCGSVELLQLLAGVREKAGRESEARQALEQARETQAK